MPMGLVKWKKKTYKRKTTDHPPWDKDKPSGGGPEGNRKQVDQFRGEKSWGPCSFWGMGLKNGGGQASFLGEIKKGMGCPGQVLLPMRKAGSRKGKAKKRGEKKIVVLTTCRKRVARDWQTKEWEDIIPYFAVGP